MGQISIDQSHQVMATLAANTDWESIDFKESGLQDSVIRNPVEAGRQFTLFLQNGGKIIVSGSRVIFIDRTKPFDPEEFLCEGWTIDEQDERSLALSQIDLANVYLEHMLKAGESYIKGEESLERLKKVGHIRLDAKVFQTLRENPNKIPESWKRKTDSRPTIIRFDGTILRTPGGYRDVLCLVWDDDWWRWDFSHQLNADWDTSRLSAVLAST